jgi:streptomycin 6-kinase
MVLIMPIAVPPGLTALYERRGKPDELAWLARLPGLAESLLDRWGLHPDGTARNGMVSLVLPVRRDDGRRAVLKLQPVDEETEGEPLSLRTWAGHGCVLLLEHDPESGGMLLERLDADRPLSKEPDDHAALQPLAEIMARLVAVPAPAGLRHLADIATAMLAAAPEALAILNEADRQVVTYCAAAVAELTAEPGNQLLHWDLHYDNVLAGEREPWLAIDPKPLAGDPGFELLPALHNRWDEALASGDPARAIRYRFDLMIDVVGLDRDRAVGWTLGRILQNCLWDVKDGEVELNPVQVAVAEALTKLSTRD